MSDLTIPSKIQVQIPVDAAGKTLFFQHFSQKVLKIRIFEIIFFSFLLAAETTDSDSASHNSTHRDEKGKYIRIGGKYIDLEKCFEKNFLYTYYYR